MSARPDRQGVIRSLVPLALMPPASMLVHQLRYLLAFGGRAGAALAQQGHSYLHSVVPWLVLLVALACGGFLRSLGRAFTGHISLRRYALSFAALWLACSVALAAIYVGQELLEGMFATGHPPGLEGVFGYGGWWSIPAALCVGLVLAAVYHGAKWVLDEVAERRAHSPAPFADVDFGAPRSFDAMVPRLAPVAAGWSDRGPPR